MQRLGMLLQLTEICISVECRRQTSGASIDVIPNDGAVKVGSVGAVFKGLPGHARLTSPSIFLVEI